MKRIGGLAAIILTVLNVCGQVAVSDTATTGSQNSLMTFYSLQSGLKTVASNVDWHLAVSVRPSVFPSNTLQGTTLRINEAFGVQVYQVTGFTADSFNVALDTADIRNWQRLFDSDSVLDEGALNTGKNIGVYNYGWGVYSGPPLHNVVGNKVYFFQLPNRTYCKVLVQQLDRDTAWDIKIANLDNSNPRSVHISKRSYTGKNFVYLNLLSSAVSDKEPLSSTWDLQFLKYAASNIVSTQTSGVVGVWVNKGTTVAKRAHVDVNDNNYGGLTFSTALNAIGWNWKYAINNQLNHSGKDFEQITSFFRLVDSLAYFVQSAAGGMYKVVFTGYDGASTGIIRFETTQLALTGIAEPSPSISFNLFPNPSNSVLNIAQEASIANVRIYDLSGRMVAEGRLTAPISQLDISDLNNGTYILSLTTSHGQTHRKFSVVH